MTSRMMVLHSIEAADNRFRFFVLELRPQPDGRHELARRWGRIGTEGRRAIELVGDLSDVTAAFDRLLKRRLARGYRVVEDTHASAASDGLASAPKPERAIGSLVAFEAHLLDALVRTRKRLTTMREGLRPRAFARTRRRAPVEQLDLF
jgi:predicted DNA-binding WGR domain protein